MIHRVRKAIEGAELFDKGEGIVVAVSGGADSVALLHILHALSPDYGWRLTAAHLNHGLRGAEADEDEAFVQRLCAALRVPCRSQRLDVRAIAEVSRGASLEETARVVRYRWLRETADHCGARKIATGHHRDDQAETVLMNLIRGSGVEGLKGIDPFYEGRIVRPLLGVEKEEILAFLHRKGQPFRADSSNQDTAFFRNRVRTELLPLLTDRFNPKIAGSLCRTAEIARREDDYLQGEVSRILGRWGIRPGQREVNLPMDEWRDLHIALQGRIVKHLLGTMAVPGSRIGHRHIEAVLSACGPPEHCLVLHLPGGIVLSRSKNGLQILRTEIRKRRGAGISEQQKTPEFAYPIPIPGAVRIRETGAEIRFAIGDPPSFEELRRSARIAYLDLEGTEPPFLIRNFRPGDRIEPLGMGGTQKVKALFIDAKVPHELRNRIPLLVDQRSILWIAGLKISEKVRVREQTKKVLKAEMV